MGAWMCSLLSYRAFHITIKITTRQRSQVERGVIKPDIIERFKKEIWIVAHQMPRARIVGLFKSYIDAQGKYNKVADKNCPLIYQCPIYMVKDQAGYNKRLKLR